MRPIPARAYVFIAITCLVAVPFVALGVQDVLGDEPPTVAFYIWALCVLLSLRPIRIATNVELSASEVAVLAGVVLLPPGTLALIAGSARLVNDLVTRKSFIRIVRNTAAQAISAGVAAMSFQLVIMSMLDRITGTVGEVIVALPAFRNVLPGGFGQESGGYQSPRGSGWTFGRRLAEPPHDDLLGPVDLLVDLPPRSHESVDIFLVFANVRVLADHQFALSWTAGSKLARREHATDLGPKRWLPFRIDSRGPALESFVDRITLRRKAGSLGNGRLLAGGWARNVSTAEPANDRSILDLFGAVGTCTHGPLRLARSSA